jgi:ribonuclease HI
MPTDDNLQLKGLSFPSLCNLCGKQSETTKQLCLQCSFSMSLSNRLNNVINLNIKLSFVLTIIDIFKRGWSPQGKLVIASAVINTLNAIWFCRNNIRFNNTNPNTRASINMNIANTSISGNLTTLTTSNSIPDFVLLKAFNFNFLYSRAPRTIEVLWQPPIQSWIKCNTDGAALGSTGIAACGGIFRNCIWESIGYFAYNIGVANVVFAEILAVILAIEFAYRRNWSNLWIETDSMLASFAIKSSNIVSWKLKNRWDNCLLMISNMHFVITHIFREGNHCADKLVNLGLIVVNFTWWDYAPTEILGDLGRNRLGLPNFRFY